MVIPNLDPVGTSFWSGNSDTGNIYKFDIESGAILQVLNTGVTCCVFGDKSGVFGLRFSEKELTRAVETGFMGGLIPGDTAWFDVAFSGDGQSRSFDLLFVKAGTGNVLGSIPVTMAAKYFYLVRAIDPDGDSLTYRLLDARRMPPSTP